MTCCHRGFPAWEISGKLGEKHNRGRLPITFMWASPDRAAPVPGRTGLLSPPPGFVAIPLSVPDCAVSRCFSTFNAGSRLVRLSAK